MANYSRLLYDDIGNAYKRKNLYLDEVANLQERILDSEGAEKKELKKALKDLIDKKDKHSYNIELSNFKKLETEFIKDLKVTESKFVNTLDKNISNKTRKLKLRLFRSIELCNFYKDYVDLCYDAEFEYKKNKAITEQIPDIINFLEENEKILKVARKEKSELNKEDIADNKINLKNFKKESKKEFHKAKAKLVTKRSEGVISKKAELNGIKELKRRYKKSLKIKSYESPHKANRELIKSKKYEIRKVTHRMIGVLNANISDIRRRTPVETLKTRALFAYFTFLIPGLGQILNGQKIKGCLFLITSYFTYFIAIPYALGYGNYQGQGIAGLITLAKGGARIHKSMIFMIEGILAIILVILAILAILISFKDVLKVEKEEIKGIRPRSWYETWTSLKEDGFPYLVSLPALLIIIFIVLVPIITTTLLSFTNMDPKNQSKFGWIALENYKLIALGQGLAGKVFWLILVWTIIWTLVATSLAIFIGFVLALIANNERIKGKGFFRTIYLLPWAVPAFITTMFFSIMFSPTGALTEIISGIVGKHMEVKNDPLLTRIALITIQGWLGSSYVFLLTTGVLQAIPSDLYEAADMDGATVWQKVWRITIPLVLFQISPLLVTQYTFNFNNFNIIYLFNGGGPFNPNRYGNLAGSSDLLISYIFKLTMENQYQAIGAAITIIISIGLMFFAFLGFRNSKGFKEGRL